MCGIFFSNLQSTPEEYNLFSKISHRGPELSIFQIRNSFTYGFHRLGIIHPNSRYNQPFVYNNIVVLCNGEIYNWKELIKTYELPSESEMSSDCEVLVYLYEKLNGDFEKMTSLLDGEFAIILHDIQKNRVYVCRDFMGIRPLYYSNNDNSLKIASEIKCFHPDELVNHILPRTIFTFFLKTDRTVQNISIKKYWNFPDYNPENSNEDKIIDDLYHLLYNSVKSRLVETDRQVGCLLSGGLDSSLIVSLASRINPNIQCFTIGLKNSPDVKAAKIVADYLKIPLSVVDFDISEGIRSIPDVIYHLETYDITTVRASTPQYLLAQWIRNNTDIKVILSGEGSDEIFSGYIYSKLAPNADELWKDGIKLLSELYLFDCLRTDRTISSAGLEVRVPFLNKELINYILQINPQLRMCDIRIEKYLLRKMVKKYGLLPEEIYTRPKEAFSDAVSDEKTSWYRSIQTKIFPMKEKEWYKNLFSQFYPNQEHILPHFWMPNWSNTMDPSATTLGIYSKKQELVQI